MKIIHIEQLFFIVLLLLVVTDLNAQIVIPSGTAVSTITDAGEGDFYITVADELYVGMSDGTLKPVGRVTVKGTNEGDVLKWNATTNTWGAVTPTIDHIAKSNPVITTSATDLLVPDMTLSPSAGTYLVLFNAHHTTGDGSEPFTTADGVTDKAAIVNDIAALTATNPQVPTFTNGEVLVPGIYDVVILTLGAGTITLDGQGLANPLFIFRSPGAFTTAATTEIALINGATSNNVFWMTDAAINTAAGTSANPVKIKGNLISKSGAITFGAYTDLEGRMLTTLGALAAGANCNLKIPVGASPIDLGALSSFVMFTSSGAVSTGAGSTITGDVGGGAGAIAISGTHNGVIYPAGTTGATVVAINSTTYSIYNSGVLLPNSSITKDAQSGVVALHGLVTITAGDAIEIRSKVDTGASLLDHRTLSLIRAGF